mgnify:CR=1 FL=1
MATPFYIRRNVSVVTGGYLSEAAPWVIEPLHIEGIAFLILNKKDRKLARALGLDVQMRHPSQDEQLITWLVNLRDDRIDELINAWRRADDPLFGYNCKRT